jgi:hypothetical protein
MELSLPTRKTICFELISTNEGTKGFNKLQILKIDCISMPSREIKLLKTEAIYAYNVKLLLHNLSCDTKYYICLPMEVIGKKMLQSFQ